MKSTQNRPGNQSRGRAACTVLALTTLLCITAAPSCSDRPDDARVFAPLLLDDVPPTALAKTDTMDNIISLLDLNMLGALEAALGDDLQQQVVPLFRASLSEQIAGLMAALDSSAHAEIHRRAHTLKGSAGNIGALALSRLASEIELQARQQQTLPEALRERVASLTTSTLQALHERYPLPA